MKKILLFISLLLLNQTVMADCNYNGTDAAFNVTFSPAKILSDSSLAPGSVLAVRTVGGAIANAKTFYNCKANDVYAIIATPSVNLAAGVTGVLGGPVYETGIPGIGFEISEAIAGAIGRPVPATLGTVSAYGLSDPGVKQLTVWLIKTRDNIDTSFSGKKEISVSYRAGSVNQVNANSSIARLAQANIKLGPFSYRQTTCNINPRGGSSVNLSNIEASQLKAITQGGVTGKQKDFTLDITCPDSSVGTKYTYWFNPITENSASKDGVLLNSIPDTIGGAKDVGFIIKQGSSPITFFDYKNYSIASMKKSQSLTFTADYYKLSNTITPGSVRAIFEIILQEE
ncbi:MULTISPECIES: fimbrial protein [Klebsiella]|uniref:fimbrial protein n=1 Tax=Klebsiella TaxID=570 RepID=UPI0003BEF115|nr:fimbrial protein [Klebsiella oxytoca]EGT0044945.1 fimbrial protein [Klebsiella oxytoca]ELP2756953.1 fimbrial protein [Klebsiella oxytoca]ELR0730648.1 fimbrial protein [Klebsiella oxytoca]ELT8148088.1 fimbrial protein [Klebsiella oxytoca]ELT9465286.1 fimbrial protein [Klebsiella oxytoca]